MKNNKIMILALSLFIIIIFNLGSQADLPYQTKEKAPSGLQTYQTMGTSKISSVMIINAPGAVIENQVLTTQNITLINSPNSIIRNNTISGFNTNVGIYVENSNNTVITNNTISNLYKDTGSVSGIAVSNSHNITIKNNIISNITTVSPAYSISLTYSSNITVLNNSISNMNNVNGSIGSYDYFSQNITYENNFVENLNSSYSSEGIYSIVGNTINIQNNSINKVNTRTTGCCFLSQGIVTFYTNYSKIIRNSVGSITATGSAYNYGITIRNSNVSLVQNNYLTNISSYADPGETLGIFSDTSNNVTLNANILDNVFSKNNTIKAIATQSGENISITNNVLSTIHSPDADVTGIYLIYNPLTTVENNFIFNLSAKLSVYGIEGWSSDNCKITNNQLSNLSTAVNFRQYLFSGLNNSIITMSNVNTVNKTGFMPITLNTVNYTVIDNGILVQNGTTDFYSGATLNNLTGNINNIILSFITSGVNETYVFILNIKSPTSLHTISVPTMQNPMNNTELLNKKFLPLNWTPSLDSLNHSVRYSLYYSTNMNSWTLITQNLVGDSYNFSLLHAGLTSNETLYLKLVAYDYTGLEKTVILTYTLKFTGVSPTTTSTPITTSTSTGSNTSTSSPLLQTTRQNKSTDFYGPSFVVALSLLGLIIIRNRRKK